MPSKQIQWFPGHMAKTRRLITENLKNVDIVIELLDARIPLSSKNPEIKKLIGENGKPTIILLNKASLADPVMNDKWVSYYTSSTTRCILTDCADGKGIQKIAPIVKEVLAEKIQRYQDKGMAGRKLRAMVVGIPNVGKSSLINRIAGNKKAKVENRPGVTLNKQWISTNMGFDLMDMPGILWPKFEDKLVGENLALTGAIKDAILDVEELAVVLCNRLRTLYPALLCERYKLGTPADIEKYSDYELFELIGKKRGFLMAGGVVNTERTAGMLLDEFRGMKIGRITLDALPEKKTFDQE